MIKLYEGLPLPDVNFQPNDHNSFKNHEQKKKEI